MLVTGCRKRARVCSSESRSDLPHEILVEILARLPVKSLLRFCSVCKAWRSVISEDPSLARLHLQHQQRQPSSFLILPLIEPQWRPFKSAGDRWQDDRRNERSRSSRRIAFYRWAPPAEGETGTTTASSLVHAVDGMLSPARDCFTVPHDVVAHCDGLVLVPTREGKVHLFNPATRQAVTLPWSPGSVAPSTFRQYHHDRWLSGRLPQRQEGSVAPHCSREHEHQAFGLGYDPRSGFYKVARYFHRQVFVVATGRHELTTGMEVFTVGKDQRRWREVATQPTHPVTPGRTATFFRGSLLWVIDERCLPRTSATAPGFLRFSLEDEAFGITPAPPCHPRLDYATSRLSELSGDLCVARIEPDTKAMELWMTQDALHPRWERRYATREAIPWPTPVVPCPVAAAFDGKVIVFHDVGFDNMDAFLCGFHPQTRGFKNIVQMYRMRYHNSTAPGDFHTAAGTDGTQTEYSGFFVIPYRESLLRLV